MAELHETLALLAHADWSEIPRTELSTYLATYFAAGELLCNSVPFPPNGTPFESVQPHFDTPNAAKSSNDVYASPARPGAPDHGHASLQKSWGKPMKFSSKENPLHVALYKMAGHDRHGAWFARHNVLEGISFSKFKKAVLREFPETLLTQGTPGAGAIRGLSAERRVERIDADNGGRVEVYQLSAQMPPPVSPRDFLTLFMTTDQALTEKSPTVDHNGNTYIPRHFMIVSRSLDHPEAPQRSSFVRGSYQSVELAREIPLHTVTGGDPELNPIEWIMVTRSDPAGGIPRFLIDRGTPGAMLTDVTKFLDWACAQEEIPDPDGDVDKQKEMSAQFGQVAQDGDGTSAEQGSESSRGVGGATLQNPAEQAPHENAAQQEISHQSTPPENPQPTTREAATDSTSAPQSQDQESGLISNISSSLEAGITAYAPISVSNFVSKQLHPEAGYDSTSSESSDDSFLSASEMKRLSTAPEHPYLLPTDNIPTTNNNSHAAETKSTLSSSSATSSQSQLPSTDKKNLNRHEKELLKLSAQRDKLDDKTSKKREAEEAKFSAALDKESADDAKAREKMEKELQKTQERHRREVEKLERKREKELRKAEERRRKKDEGNKLALVARERDDLRERGDLWRKENALLGEQVDRLEREREGLVEALRRLGGPEAVESALGEAKGSGSLRRSGEKESRASLSSSEKNG